MSGTLVLVGRLSLAALLALAAAAKLADRDGTRTALRAFGVPGRVAPAGSVALPTTELLLAALLVPAATASQSAAGVAALLLCFTFTIAYRLARGERPDCNCFGAARSRPVGPAMLLRNLLLVGVAASIAAAGPGTGIPRQLWQVALGVAAASLLPAAIWLARENRRLRERVRQLEGGRTVKTTPLSPGQPAPELDLPDLDGNRRSLADLTAAGRPVALVFSDPNCAACGPTLARVADLYERRGTEFAVITRGQSHSIAKTGATVLLQRDHEAFDAYAVRAVPSAVVIDADGRIASHLAVGPDAIEALLAPEAERHRIVAVAEHDHPVADLL